MLRPYLFFSSLVALLVSGALASAPLPAQAGCGCDKPPPEPAAVIPNAAFSGMKITLFSPAFVLGQQWTVRFRNGATEKTVTSTVKAKRDIVTMTLGQYEPHLVVTVPNSLPLGPTRIEAFTPLAPSLTVLEDSFTVIGQPLTIWEGTATYKIWNHKMAVGEDGTLYLAVDGMNNVCQAMSFGAQLTEYPVRFGSGDVVIRNFQGYLIDLLDTAAADHFEARPGGWGTSNELYYFRHSFEQFCQDHQPGHNKEVEATDANWHKDGTPHTDYSTLIFAIAGHLPNGQPLAPGSIVSDVILTQRLGTGAQNWEQEHEEEHRWGGRRSWR
jgi:hypothetical protein